MKQRTTTGQHSLNHASQTTAIYLQGVPTAHVSRRPFDLFTYIAALDALARVCMVRQLRRNLQGMRMRTARQAGWYRGLAREQVLRSHIILHTNVSFEAIR
jgi:hypothetical protein